MKVLDWNTYLEALGQAQERLFKLNRKIEKLTELSAKNQLVNLEQIESSESLKEDLIRRTKIMVDRILNEGENNLKEEENKNDI